MRKESLLYNISLYFKLNYSSKEGASSQDVKKELMKHFNRLKNSITLMYEKNEGII